MSSLHSTPSPIHRHPFSTNVSPTDAEEPHPNGVEGYLCRCASEDLSHGAVDCNKQDHNTSAPSKPVVKHAHNLPHNPGESNDQILTSQTGLKKSTNQHLHHVKPDADPVQNSSYTQGHRFSPSPPETVGTIKLQEGGFPEVKQHPTVSTENHFNLSNQRERRASSSDSWLSSPELDHNRGTKSGSTRGGGRTRVKMHNNNHIRLKSSEKEKGATSPPAQAST